MEATLIAAVATLLAGFGGAALGALAVWRSQTRALGTRERAIAAALLQDLKRIESAVPIFREGEGVKQYAGLSYPALHRWIQPLIVELAARDPEIVGGCMQLELLLTRHQHARQVAWEAESHVDDERATLGRIQARAEQPLTAQERATDEASSKTVSERLAHAERSFEIARRGWVDEDRDLRAALGELRRRLGFLIAAPLPETLLPSEAELRDK